MASSFKIQISRRLAILDYYTEHLKKHCQVTDSNTEVHMVLFSCYGRYNMTHVICFILFLNTCLPFNIRTHNLTILENKTVLNQCFELTQ